MNANIIHQNHGQERNKRLREGAVPCEGLQGLEANIKNGVF